VRGQDGAGRPERSAAGTLGGDRTEPAGRLRVVLASLVLALVVGPSKPGLEQLDFRWQAPEGCPGSADVRGHLRRYLGHAVYSEAIAAVRVRAKVEAPARRGAPYRLRVRVVLPVGEVQREVAAAACDRLAAAAALIVAVALDPLRAEARLKVEARRPEPSEPPPPRRVRRTWAELRFGGGLLAAVLPGVSGVAAVEVALVRRMLRVAVAGRYLAPRTSHPYPSDPAVGVSVMGGSVAARACVVPAVFRVEFPLCAEVEAGALRARGVGLPQVRTSHRPLVAVGVGPEIAWRSRRGWGLYLAVDGSVWLLRPQFEAEGLGRALLAGPGAFRAVGGVLARF